MRPNPLHDVAEFLTKPAWYTGVFWLLLLGSMATAWIASRQADQRGPRAVVIWLVRLFLGIMWWQQSLWKIPPHYGGLIYWMKMEVDHATIALQSQAVAGIVIPNIAVFGPAVYAVEVAIAVSLMLGLFTRVFVFLGLLEAIELWLGLYSAPGEWPWTYFFITLLHILFVLDPPGRCLGLDAIMLRGADVRSRLRPTLSLLM